MGQHSISKYKTKMGGIYITADTFTGEKGIFPVDGTSRALDLVWKKWPKVRPFIEYIRLLEVANGLTVQLGAWKEKGWKIRDKAI